MLLNEKVFYTGREFRELKRYTNRLSEGICFSFERSDYKVDQIKSIIDQMIKISKTRDQIDYCRKVFKSYKLITKTGVKPVGFVLFGVTSIVFNNVVPSFRRFDRDIKEYLEDGIDELEKKAKNLSEDVFVDIEGEILVESYFN